MEKDKYRIERVDKATCKDFLLKHHYLSKQGHGFRCGFNYGLFDEDVLVGVAIFHGISAGETVVGCFGLTKNDQAGFFELGRLAMDPERKVKNLTSWFLAKTMKQLRADAKPRAIITYADAAYHHGYIYQACNFTYHGLTAKKTDAWVKGPDGTFKKCGRGRPRGDDVVLEWRPRTQKHRYLKVYDKKLHTLWPQVQYPKGNNSEY